MHEVAGLIATVPRFADLLDEPVWPECVELTPAQLGELMDVAKSERRILGGFPREDYGEIATVIWARDSGSTAILDDNLGRYLAKEWGVQFRRTHHVVVAMVREGSLSHDEGWAIWRECLPNSTRGKFEAACN